MCVFYLVLFFPWDSFFKCLCVWVSANTDSTRSGLKAIQIFWQGILLLTFSPSNSPMKMHSCLYQVGIMQWTCLAVAYKLGIMIEACIRKVHWLTCDLLKPLGEWWRNLFLKLFPFKIMATFCTSRYKISSYRFLCPPFWLTLKELYTFFFK